MLRYDPVTSKCRFYLDLLLGILQTQGQVIQAVKKTREQAFSFLLISEVWFAVCSPQPLFLLVYALANWRGASPRPTQKGICIFHVPVHPLLSAPEKNSPQSKWKGYSSLLFGVPSSFPLPPQHIFIIWDIISAQLKEPRAFLAATIFRIMSAKGIPSQKL